MWKSVLRRTTKRRPAYRYLYVTEKGKRLSRVHKAYDVADITQTTAYLVEQCSEADLDAFYRVIEQYTKLLKSEQ